MLNTLVPIHEDTGYEKEAFVPSEEHTLEQSPRCHAGVSSSPSLCPVSVFYSGSIFLDEETNLRGRGEVEMDKGGVGSPILSCSFPSSSTLTLFFFFFVLFPSFLSPCLGCVAKALAQSRFFFPCSDTIDTGRTRKTTPSLR